MRTDGQALFGFVRFWSRRVPTTDPLGTDQGRLVMVVEAALDLTARGAPATINAIAEEVGIDQSGASRLVHRAVAAGHAELRTSPYDGRRREVLVTPAGRSLLREARAWQERVFSTLTEDWSDRRRREFVRAMTDILARAEADSVVPGC
ncbi:MarR family transcriptional regulator [Nocardioides marmoriginsengisoli]|uniref:MarR family transcriptional regulator n=1 Tax=Nocardioides marmoriginsengisoli TaxID=661483 RepID=A0A3N0CHJ4_9ACTN|nr:MarR family winged helix-turn-helix transcriptional regulator [Nocardioides marmoriginsengisoli]RNL62473.1 MarR family transcriptional regulator [Nocardioides marmoriginsengisoli]